MTDFAAPWWLLLVVPVLLRLIVAIVDRRRGRGAFVFSALSIVGRRRTLRSLTAFMPLFLATIGLLLVIVAMARPQKVTTLVDDRKGIDIVITLDASGSMAAEDFRPRNRFTVAKDLVAEFIDKRENDRIGIVTFGARAATRVPITFDHAVAQQALERAEVGENGDGTAIGHAIAVSANRLRTSKARSRIIILLTDGVNNAGSIEPTTAAAIAKRLGLKLYAIGVGSRGNVPIPVKQQNRFTGEIETIYQLIRADLDDEMLTSIAESTGGNYFRATDEKALETILNRIDQLEKSAFTAPKTRTVKELYFYPMVAGLALLGLAILGGETVWMRLPA